MQTLKTTYVALDELGPWTGKITSRMSDHITKAVGSSNWRITSVGKLGVWVEVKRSEPKPSFEDLRERSEGLSSNDWYYVYGGFSWRK
jgi:hypothetical protein